MAAERVTRNMTGLASTAIPAPRTKGKSSISPAASA
jgi:hypothetical protein